MDMIKDFKVTQGGRAKGDVKENKKLADDAVKKIKETKEVTADDYLAVAKGNKTDEVEVELSKAKQENALEVPNTFYDLALEEQSMLMFYLSSDFEHPITKKRTHMNVLQSYITTYMDEDDIFSIWEKEVQVHRKGTDGKLKESKEWVPEKKLLDDREILNVRTGKIKNYPKYNKTKLNAMKVFNQNKNITDAWNDLVKMTFGLSPEDLLQTAILQDALHSDTYQDKNANRKMAIEMLGMGKNAEGANQFNVFVQGGGKELVDAIGKYTHDEHLTTEDDLDPGDD